MTDPSALVFWASTLLLTAGTLCLRGSFIWLLGRIKQSEAFVRGLRFIPVAVLPAIVVPSVFLHQGDVAWLQGYERGLAWCMALIVAFLTRSMLATIGAGMAALHLLLAL
jgi:branched-subunit amino acid transport protein